MLLSYCSSTPHCINWPCRPPHLTPFCFRWNCPLHGHDVRKKAARSFLAAIDRSAAYSTCALHLNRRLHGPFVGRLAARFFQGARRKTWVAQRFLFVHARGCHHSLSPYPHLHPLVGVPRGMDGGLTQTITFREPWWDGVRVLPWQKVDDLDALVLYLFRARTQDRWLPAGQLPRSGDRYRQVYGRPRRGG